MSLHDWADLTCMDGHRHREVPLSRREPLPVVVLVSCATIGDGEELLLDYKIGAAERPSWYTPVTG